MLDTADKLELIEKFFNLCGIVWTNGDDTFWFVNSRRHEIWELRCSSALLPKVNEYKSRKKKIIKKNFKLRYVPDWLVNESDTKAGRCLPDWLINKKWNTYRDCTWYNKKRWVFLQSDA